MDSAITRNGSHVAMSGFDIALQAECEICGSADVSVVGDEDAASRFEFVRRGTIGCTAALATTAVVVSCAECGTTYELQS
jgi:Zn finger protein HypA/HybF involved in hydrogenase expression